MLMLFKQQDAAYLTEVRMKSTIMSVNKDQPKQQEKMPKDDQGKQKPRKNN